MVIAHYNSLCHTTPRQSRKRGATRWRDLLHSQATQFTAGKIQPLRNNTRERSEQAVGDGDRNPSLCLLKQHLLVISLAVVAFMCKALPQGRSQHSCSNISTPLRCRVQMSCPQRRLWANPCQLPTQLQVFHYQTAPWSLSALSPTPRALQTVLPARKGCRFAQSETPRCREKGNMEKEQLEMQDIAAAAAQILSARNVISRKNSWGGPAPQQLPALSSH